MMLPSEKLFENCFNNLRITPFRLSNYTIDSIARLETIDVEGIFKVARQAIVDAHLPFHDGISLIDTSMGVRKGKTMLVNEVKIAFGSYLSDHEAEIARLLGGRETADYMAFYPHGLMEYTRANKAQMPLLVKRIDTLATKYATKLGEATTQQLQSFILLWQEAFGEQANVKSSLSDGRSDRGTLRTNLELALINAIHLVGAQYPGDVVKCMSFFDFNLLTGNSRKAAAVAPTPTVTM